MSFFQSFSFANLPYLFGLFAALIPLIIHLSRSRRTKKMRFSTTRFFTDQFLRSYRMSRLKELLLLACRMALFALLAMALTQRFVGYGLALSGGVTLYVAASDLIPEVNKMRGLNIALTVAAGVGMVIVLRWLFFG